MAVKCWNSPPASACCSTATPRGCRWPRRPPSRARPRSPAVSLPPLRPAPAPRPSPRPRRVPPPSASRQPTGSGLAGGAHGTRKSIRLRLAGAPGAHGGFVNPTARGEWRDQGGAAAGEGSSCGHGVKHKQSGIAMHRASDQNGTGFGIHGTGSQYERRRSRARPILSTLVRVQCCYRAPRCVMPVSTILRTSRMEYHPCRPCTQRAARSAPCAKVARSRHRVRQGDGLGGPSNPAVCVPGTCRPASRTRPRAWSAPPVASPRAAATQSPTARRASWSDEPRAGTSRSRREPRPTRSPPGRRPPANRHPPRSSTPRRHLRRGAQSSAARPVRRRSSRYCQSRASAPGRTNGRGGPAAPAGREVDDHIGARLRGRLPRLGGAGTREHADDLDAVLRRMHTHQPAHAAMAEQNRANHQRTPAGSARKSVHARAPSLRAGAPAAAPP